MNRPRTLSSAARTGGGGSDTLTNSGRGQGDNLNHLSDSMSRNRAVENDYSDHPLNPQAPRRSASAPTGAGDSNTTRSSHHPSRRHAASDRSRRHHSNRTRRAPGSAARIVNPSASLPPYLGTRNIPIVHDTLVSSRNELCHPVIPPRPHQYPATVGHMPPRRHVLDADLINRPPPPVPRQPVSVPGEVQTTQLTSLAPPRPPPPAPEVAERLGVPPSNRHADSVVRTVPPTSTVRCVTNTTVISTQPTGQAEKARLVSETDDEKSSTAKSEEATKSTNNSSLKKGSDRGRIAGTGDEDHQLMGPLDGRSAPKPGEHNYSCPRCGKCTCPRCQGDVPGTTEAARRAASRCWTCSQRCSCNATNCIETATCLCCVRACFYHCSEEDDECSDEPCSCHGSHCCLRWSALGALSVFLPCLLCYPLARGCLRACKSCSACVRPGCRCKESYR